MSMIQGTSKRRITVAVALLLLLAVLVAVAICLWDDFMFWWNYDVRYDESLDRYVFYGVRYFDGETLVLPEKTPDGHTVTDIFNLARTADDEHKQIKKIEISDSYEYGNLDLRQFPSLERLEIGKGFDFSHRSVLGFPADLEIVIDSENPLYQSSEGCVLSKDGKTLVVGSETGEIPASVERIMETAFAYNSHIRAVSVPTGVRKIETSAFTWCENLRAVWIPETVTEFVGNPFSSCHDLTVVFESSALPSGASIEEIKETNERATVQTGVTREEFLARFGE